MTSNSTHIVKSKNFSNSYALFERLYSVVGVFVVCMLGLLHAQKISATEIVKWVDENGQVHFGDRAPIGKKDVTEKIKIQHAPVNKPEKDVIKKQVDYWYRQKLAKEKQQAKKNASKKSAKNTSDEDNLDQASPEAKRKYCRDNFSYNVKLRTECFNNI